MKNRGKRLALFVLAAALLTAALAGTAFATEGGIAVGGGGGGGVVFKAIRMDLTAELRDSDGALQISGVAEGVPNLFAAAYDAQGRMTEVCGISDKNWSVSFSGTPDKLKFFVLNENFVSIPSGTPAMELRPALQVGDQSYWTMAEAETAAATEKTITVVDAYFGPAASAGYTLTLNEKGDFNNGKAFLTEVGETFALTNSGSMVNALTLDNSLTRLTAAYLLTDVAFLPVQPDATVDFTDVNAADVPVVAAVVNNGMMNGIDPETFMPENILTTEQVAMLVCRGMGLNKVAFGEATAKLETLGIAEAGTVDSANTPITQRTFLDWLCKASYAEVGTEADLRAALNGKLVQSIRVTESITLKGAARDCKTLVTKSVTVAAGKTLTVAAYVPEQGEPAPEGFAGNFLIIANGGSLTLEPGAVASTITDMQPNPFHLYRGQINVEGGKLVADEGSIGANSFLAYASGTMALPDEMENVQIMRLVGSEDDLREAMNEAKYSEVMLTKSVRITSDLTLTKLLTVQEGSTLTVAKGRTLTVPENVELCLNGDALVQGTLVNQGYIENNSLLDVIGGRLENSGRIQGRPQNTIVGLEKGGALQNHIGEKMGVIEDEIDLCYYYPVSGEVGGEREEVFVYTLTDDPVMENCVRVAVTFSKAQAQAALSMTDDAGPVYTGVIYSGAEHAAVNELDIGGLTVPEGQTLILKATVFDGTNTYHNRYIVDGGKTLTMKDHAGLILRGESGLKVHGNLRIGANCRFTRDEDFTLGGKLVDSAEELAAALEQGGEIYLAPFPMEERVEVPTGDGTDLESKYVLTEPFTVSSNTTLIPLGRIGVFAQGGFTVEGGDSRDAWKTLKLDGGLFFAVQANSTVNGVLDVVGGSMLRICQPDGAPTEAESVALTVYGDMNIGAVEDSGMLFVGSKAQLLNGGTVQIYSESGCIMEEDAAMINVALFQNGGYMETQAETIVITDNYFINFGTLEIQGTLRNVSNFINRDRVTVSGGTLQNEGTYYNGYCYLPWMPNPGIELYEARTILHKGGQFLNAPTGVEQGAYDEDWGGYISSFRVDTTSGAAFANYESQDGSSVGRCDDNFIAIVNSAEILGNVFSGERYRKIEIENDVTVNGDLTIPAGRCLEIQAGGSLTVTGNLIAGQNAGIDVYPGGSLNIGGSVRLATSTMDHRMDDAGYVEAAKDGSLTVGGVQYVGANGVLTLDGETAWFVLSGIPMDCAVQGHPEGVFAFLTGNATVEDNKTFEIPEAWDNFIVNGDVTLTVNGTLVNNSGFENRGSLEVKGTLTNNGTLEVEGSVTAYGGTVENTGTIRGESGDANISIEKGGALDNVIGGKEGTIKDVRISIVDSYPASGDPVISKWKLFADEEENNTAPELDYFDLGAVAYGTDAIQTALDVCVGEQEGWYRYQYVIACGTEPAGEPETFHTVELGGIEVHEGGVLQLCNWFDGEELYLNNYIISADTTLTLNRNARLECQRWGSNTLTIDGEIVNNGGSVDFGGFNVRDHIVVAYDTDTLKAALNDNNVNGITLTGDAEISEETTITKPMYITAGRTLTISADVTFCPEKHGADGIATIQIEEGASLIVTESGKLTTQTNFAADPLIPAEVVVNGGTLDASAGVLKARIDYRSGTLLLPEDGDKNEGTEVFSRLYGADCNEERLAEALNDARIGQIDVQEGLEVNKPLTVNKTVKIWGGMDVNGAVTVVPGGLLEVEQDSILAVNPNGSLTVKAGGALATCDGAFDGNDHYNADGTVYVRGSLIMEDGASVNNGFGAMVLHLIHDGGSITIGTLAGDGSVEKGYIVFNQEQLNAALADPNINYLQINRGDDLVYTGSVTLPGGLRVSNGSLTIDGDLTVNGELAVNEGASLTVTGKLIKGDGANVMLEGKWNDEGFVGYKCDFSAANVIEDENGLAAALENGGSYYLKNHPGDCYHPNALTVSGDVTLDGLDNNVRIELHENLTVNKDAALTVGERVEFQADGVTNNGVIVGNLRFNENNYSGSGVIYTQNNLCDLARTIYENFGAYPGLTVLPDDTDWAQYAKGCGSITNWAKFVSECFERNDRNALMGMSLLLENELLTGKHDAYEAVDETSLKSVLTALVNKVDVGESEKTAALGHISGIDLYNDDLFSARYCVDENNPERHWVEWQQDKIVDTLKNDLALFRREVTTEAELMEALNTPYVTEIHVTENVTLNGAYYKDGQFVSATEPENPDDYNDGPSVYLFPAGENRDQWREIIVEPGATLTVAQGVKLNIQRDVKLRVEYNDNDTPENGDDDRWGNLTVRGNINVSGELEPNEDDRNRITVDENAWIDYYADSYWFGGALRAVAGQYMSKTLDDVLDDAALKSYREMDGWDDNTDFTVLVAYGLTPESDDQGHSWWNPGRTLSYGEIRTILTNVYQEAYPKATALPDSVAVGDENWQPQDHDILSNRDVEELLQKFSAALPKETATVSEFIVERRDCSAGDGNPDCDGGIHELVNGSHDNNVRNLHFAEAVTISNATNLPGNDNWGGMIRFANCSFDKDVTVIYNPAYNFRVEFDANCEFAEDVKVNVVQADGAPDADLLANNNVTVHFDCAGGEVVSSARVNVEAANDVSFIFNGVTVSGRNAENGSFGASMFFNCTAEHPNDFDWGRNDHSKCDGGVSSEYQFTANGNAKMTVSGTTAENLPIRIAGTVDVSKLEAWENEETHEKQEITLHNWNGGHNNVMIGSNSVTVVDVCEETRINGVNLSPHVFGRYKDGLFIGLRGAKTAPTFALERWGWDEEQHEDVLQPVGFTTEYFDESGNTYTGEEQGFDITQMVKAHLEPAKGYDFMDNMGLVLIVDFGGSSVAFNGIWWKPVTETEFANRLNEMLGTEYTFESFDLSDDYLTYDRAGKILSTAWKNYDSTIIGMPDLHEIIRDDNYWGQRDEWNRQYDEAEDTQKWLEENEGRNPDNWTWDWNFANNVIRNLRNKLGVAATVTNAQELLDALAEGYTEIRVTQDITVDFGEADEYCPHNVYLNRADGVDEQVIYVQPGKTFTVGGMVMPEGGTEEVLVRVKLDIQDGVRVVLCTDETGHGVLCVNKDSCVNVFGALDTPEDNTYIVRAEGANVSYKKRLAELGGRLYDRLRESGKVAALTGDDLQTPVVTDDWPGADDEWGLNAISFLRKYAGLTTRTDGDRERWPSWDHARYGQVMELLGKTYKALTDEDMPGTVKLDWTPDDDHVLDDYGVDTLIDRFMTALLPREEMNNAAAYTLVRKQDGSESVNGGSTNISGSAFKDTVTVSNDTQLENDDWGGVIRFANCSFDKDVTVIYNPDYNFKVEFDANCVFLNSAKVNVVPAEGTQELGNSTVTVKFESAGELVSSAYTRVELIDGVGAKFNNVDLSAQVLNRNKDKLYVGLNGAEQVPTFALENADGESIEFNIDKSQPGKVHLTRTDGSGFDDNMGLKLTVNFDNGSIIFNGIWWKPILVNEFISLINDGQSLTEDRRLTLNGLELTRLNGNDYLTNGSAKAILSAAWTALNTGNKPDLDKLLGDIGSDDRTVNWDAAANMYNKVFPGAV